MFDNSDLFKSSVASGMSPKKQSKFFFKETEPKDSATNNTQDTSMEAPPAIQIHSQEEQAILKENPLPEVRKSNHQPPNMKNLHNIFQQVY